MAENADLADLYAALGEEVGVGHDEVLCLANVIKPRPARYRQTAFYKPLDRDVKRHGEGQEHRHGSCAHENSGEYVRKAREILAYRRGNDAQNERQNDEIRGQHTENGLVGSLLLGAADYTRSRAASLDERYVAACKLGLRRERIAAACGVCGVKNYPVAARVQNAAEQRAGDGKRGDNAEGDDLLGDACRGEKGVYHAQKAGYGDERACVKFKARKAHDAGGYYIKSAYHDGKHHDKAHGASDAGVGKRSRERETEG